jgi:hypothetical protein
MSEIDDDDDGYLPTADEIQRAADGIRENWTENQAYFRRIHAPEPVDCPPEVRTMAEQRSNDSRQPLFRDPVGWFDMQEEAIRLAIRSGDFDRAKAVIERVQALGLDYEPPQEITSDSWLGEIFHDVALLNRFEAIGITRARHLLELSPARLREITTLADRIIEVMRQHFENPKQPTGPTPTSGVVDWTVHSPRVPHRHRATVTANG